MRYGQVMLVLIFNKKIINTCLTLLITIDIFLVTHTTIDMVKLVRPYKFFAA